MKIQIIRTNRHGLRPGDVVEAKWTKERDGYEVTFKDACIGLFGGGDKKRTVIAFVAKDDAKLLT